MGTTNPARPRGARLLALLLASACGPAAPSGASAGPFAFERVYVDRAYGGSGRPGWVRAADLDGDGDVEIVAGGGEALFVYERAEAGSWHRLGSLDATGKMGANGAALFDADGDGDLDVVSALYYGELGWWENPGPPLSDAAWVFHPLGDESWFLHDLEPVDLDGDGVPGELVANLVNRGIESDVRVEILRPPPAGGGAWQRRVVEPGRDDGRNNHAGVDAGDVDGDGRIDLAYSNGWYAAPTAPGDAWSWHPLTDHYGVSNVLLRDMDADGDLDALMSAGHHGKGVFWLEAPASPRSAAWATHPIDADVVHPECLGAADLDADGDLDVVSCDLDFEAWDREVHSLYVYENGGGAWTRHPVHPRSYPSHLLRLVDVDGDGRLDVVSEATGYSVVSLYLRAAEPAAERADDVSANSVGPSPRGAAQPLWGSPGCPSLLRAGSGPPEVGVTRTVTQATQAWGSADRWEPRETPAPPCRGAASDLRVARRAPSDGRTR